MSHYPAAVWRPVAYSGLHRRQPRRAMLLHTNGGGAQLFGWWSQIAAKGQHVGAQYQVFRDGRVECYVDPDLVVYHAFGASEWAFAVETEDDGHNTTPWTSEQIDAMARIGHFHGVPARMLTGPGPGDGVGYHQQQPAWNGSGHDCPGHVRVGQIPEVLAVLARLNSTPPHPPAPPTPAPVPAPPPAPTPPAPVQEDDMPVIVKDPDGPKQYVTDYLRKRWIEDPSELADLKAAGLKTCPIQATTLARIPDVTP